MQDSENEGTIRRWKGVDTMKTILHPTDFSECSDMAFDLAASLAEKFNARLLLLHVYPPTTLSAGVEDLVMPPDFYRESLETDLREYDRRRPTLDIEHLLVSSVRVADTILQVARDTGCETIVMGSHGRTGLTRLLMGSTAEKVQRGAGCPVAIVRHPFGGKAPPNDDATVQPLGLANAELKV